MKSEEIQIFPIWIDIIDPTIEEEKLIASIFNIDVSKHGYVSKLNYLVVIINNKVKYAQI